MMTTIRDKINEIRKGSEDEIDETMQLMVFGTLLNILDPAVTELDDDTIRNKFDDLKDVVFDKHKCYLDIEIGSDDR